MSTALFLLSIWCYVLLSVFVPCAWNAFLILSAYVCFDIGVAGVVRDLFIYLCGNTTVLSFYCCCCSSSTSCCCKKKNRKQRRRIWGVVLFVDLMLWCWMKKKDYMLAFWREYFLSVGWWINKNNVWNSSRSIIRGSAVPFCFVCFVC